MSLVKIKTLPLHVKSSDGDLHRSYNTKILVKTYPKFLGKLLAWFRLAKTYHAERETFYLTRSARQSVYKQIKGHYSLNLLPENCSERIVHQIFLDTVFKSNQKMLGSKNLSPPCVSDPILHSLNQVSDIPVVRKNDLEWIEKNVKPGSILLINPHENFAFGNWVVGTGQRLMRSRKIPVRHASVSHALICIGPGKFAEALPSGKGDQVRIVDFNQITMNLGPRSNAEYQVYEPRLESMTPENRALWENRMNEMAVIAKSYAVQNTPKAIESDLMQWIKNTIVPKRIVPSKLKYNYIDAMRSIWKRNRFNRAAKARVFKEYASQQFKLPHPLTPNGKRKFYCSSFVTWLLQAMQHKELAVALQQKLQGTGRVIEPPAFIPYPQEVERPEPLVLDPGLSKQDKRHLRKAHREEVKTYNRYLKACGKIDKKNGVTLHKWSRKMADEHGVLLEQMMECKLDARFTSPMVLQHWLHEHSKDFQLAARIIPEQDGVPLIKV